MKLSILKKIFSIEFWNSWFRKILKLLEFKPKAINRSLILKTKKLKTLIWLDDIRDPTDTRMDWLAYSPIGREVEVVWIKDYFQFKKWVLKNGLPDGICFDHDLGENESHRI